MNSTAAVPAVLTEALANLQALRAMWSRSIVSNDWLIHFPGGLFVAADIDSDNVVRSVRQVGIGSATHFLKRDAYAICRNGNLRDGSGQVAEPIGRMEALDNVIAKLRETIAAIEGRVIEYL